MLTEHQMIQKINTVISQMGLGPEYAVRTVQSTRWGLIAYWQPAGKEKEINASPFLMHATTGILKEYNDVAHRNRINPKDTNAVLAAFKEEAERKIRY